MFDITYSDISGLSFYAILFSAEDSSKAWNPTSKSFQKYTLQNQSSFVLNLIEDSERIGWYSYSISDTSNIPYVSGDDFYFIEIWKKVGLQNNREIDINTGNLEFYWGKTNNDFLEIAKKVWDYSTRTITDFPEIPPGITPQQIWEYSVRTLTQDSVSCDYAQLEKNILEAISVSTGKTLEELANVNSELGNSIQQTFDLLKICCSSPPKSSPVIQNPRIGPRGSGVQNTNMRFE